MQRPAQIFASLFLLTLLLSASKAPAQFRFDSWTTDNGLPQVSVNGILQTRDGFLWLTTYGGLVRYDGLRFQVFNPGNTKGLSTGRLIVLFEDREGSLWITTEGQGLIRYKDGVFNTYTTADGLPDNQIQSIYGDVNRQPIFQVNEELWRWTGTGTFAPYSPAAGEPVKRIMQRMPSGAIWYFEDSHLRKFDQGRVTIDLVPGVNVVRAFEDSQGRVWIAASDREGVFMLKDGKLTRYGVKDGYLDGRYGGGVTEDRHGRLRFGGSSGLTLFKDGKFTRFTEKDGLARGGVSPVYQDREGTLWAASSGGLSRVTERAVSSYSTKDGLAGENVYPIYEDRQERIWIGSWPGVTMYQDGKFQNVSERYSNPLVTAFFEDREGNFWIGAWGLIRRAPDGKITVLPQSKSLAPRIRVIYQDRAGNLWVGSGSGLFKAARSASGQANDFQFTAYSAKDGLAGKEVFAIHEDRQGQLWIGTEAGLTRHKDGRLTAVTGDDSPAGIVRSIYEDRDGTLWIGMYDKGLYRFSEGQFTHYTTNNGLFDNGAFQIIEDDRGNFWISCNLGIYRVRKSELDDFAAGRVKSVTSIPYNKRDGMLNSECNGGMQPAGIRARDGRIWFPTQQGVAVINPAAVPFNPQPPPVVIESLVVDTETVGAVSALQLKPGQEYLEIHYSGLSFINPELVRFKYKMAGLDADWINADTRRTAYYSHLPPGKYQFTVIAANRDGVWNEQGASMEIVVLLPFWRTWWFMAAVVIALSAIVFLFYSRRIAQLEHARRTQEEFSWQLIASQEGERKRIAAELHDSLGQSLLIIKNRAALGRRFLQDPEKTLEQIEEIETAASQSIKEVRHIAYDLRPYQLDEIGLTQALKDLVKNVA